jgi:hypothetical protein
MSNRKFLLVSLAVVSALLLSAAAPGDGSGCGGGDSAVASQQADIDQYNQIATDLQKARSQFLGKEADEHWASGNTLFWLEFPTFQPNLNSWSAGTGTKVKYKFNISSEGKDYNYRGGKDLVATASREGDKVKYLVYNPGQANSSAGTFQLDSPKNGTKWHAYDVDGKNVYVMVSTTGANTISRWTPGGQLTPLYKLEDKGVTVGEFWDFKVFGQRMIFIESGRIWSMDLTTGKATWLKNKTQARSAAFDNEGVLYAQSKGDLYYMPLGSATLRDINAEIMASGYQMNKTFNMAHRPANDQFALYKQTVIYTAQSGIFTFNLTTKKVAPLLLEPRDPKLRTVYRKPVVMDNGTLFVLGLQSTNGAVGAEGPIFKLMLK